MNAAHTYPTIPLPPLVIQERERERESSYPIPKYPTLIPSHMHAIRMCNCLRLLTDRLNLYALVKAKVQHLSQQTYPRPLISLDKALKF